MAWIVSPDNQWYLLVDGKWTKKSGIADDGTLLADSEVM